MNKLSVYVVQEVPGRNILSAREYGDLIPVLPVNREVILSAGPTVNKVRSVLRDFGDEDYILPMGDPAAIAIVTGVAAHLNNGKFKLLKWDRQTSTYNPIEIDVLHGSVV